MKPSSFDWQYFRQDTFWPFISMVVSVAVLGAGIWYFDEQQRTYDALSVDQEVIYEDYDDLVFRRRLLDHYYRRYNEFQTIGFVGRESRLDWIETIRATAKSLDLPTVVYSLEPQLTAIRPLETASVDAEIQIFLSRVDFELGLVHELDLLRFFDRLELEAPGLMKVDRCDMSRQSALDHSLIADTNINANCSLTIFSVLTSDINMAGAGS